MTSRRPRHVRESGLFKKHLVGDYSLARSYWLHTMVVGWGVGLLGAYAIHKIGERYAVRYLSMGVIAFQAVATLVWLWSIVGTWMSATKQLFGQGSKFWAVVAMISLIGSAVAAMGEASTLRPYLKEHWDVAKGEQPTDGFTVKLKDNGRVVEFKGGINEGAAAALDKIVGDAPHVTTVELDSPGGWLREGNKMADVVRRYRVHTRVENECFSSCTLVLLAGLDRTAGERAVVVFHRGRSIGESKQGSGAPSSEEAKLYLRAGLDHAFVDQILATPNDDIWVPTRTQLLKYQVLTR